MKQFALFAMVAGVLCCAMSSQAEAASVHFNKKARVVAVNHHKGKCCCAHKHHFGKKAHVHKKKMAHKRFRCEHARRKFLRRK